MRKEPNPLLSMGELTKSQHKLSKIMQQTPGGVINPPSGDRMSTNPGYPHQGLLALHSRTLRGVRDAIDPNDPETMPGPIEIINKKPSSKPRSLKQLEYNGLKNYSELIEDLQKKDLPPSFLRRVVSTLDSCSDTISSLFGNGGSVFWDGKVLVDNLHEYIDAVRELLEPDQSITVIQYHPNMFNQRYRIACNLPTACPVDAPVVLINRGSDKKLGYTATSSEPTFYALDYPLIRSQGFEFLKQGLTIFVENQYRMDNVYPIVEPESLVKGCLLEIAIIKGKGMHQEFIDYEKLLRGEKPGLAYIA